MAGTKTALSVDVNAEHIGLINSSREKYNSPTRARLSASSWTT